MKTTAPFTPLFARGLAAFGLALAAMAIAAGGAMAHANAVRASPPIDGSVATSPAQVEIWFSEEATAATTIRVFGPDGVRVDLGDTKLDLADPQRVHVTADLLKNLDPGSYRVEWNSVSGLDGDSANGQFAFTIGPGTPAAVSASPPAGGAAGDLTPVSSVTPIPAQFQTSGVDDKVLGVGIAAGVAAAIGIYLFWRWIKPKNPKF